MSKVLRYKKGFTWRHHFDEKWDRLEYSLKLRIQAFVFIFIFGGTLLGFAWAYGKHEKAQLIQEGAARSEVRQEKIWQGVSRKASPPPLRQAED